MDGEGPLLYPPVRARLDEGMDSGEDWDEGEMGATPGSYAEGRGGSGDDA